jgi:hypothetical protein
MRYLLFVSCLMFVLSLVLAAPAEAKGGKGGGGGGGGGHGRPTFGGGQGGGGGPKWSGQQQGHGGGQNKQFEHGDDDHGDGRHQVANRKHQNDDDQGENGKDREREDKDKDWKDRSKWTNNPVSNPTGNVTDAWNKKQKQLDLAQMHRDKQLAQAQHLRDVAQMNGNPNLMANAARMESDAWSQYADRVAHLEKFGVTDPALNPVTNPLVPGGVTNPLVPGGVTNPLVPGGITNQPLLPGGVQPLPGGPAARVIREIDSLLPLLP